MDEDRIAGIGGKIAGMARKPAGGAKRAVRVATKA